MEILDDGFDDSMTVMMLPEEMRRPLRTSNAAERLNAELKRRAVVIKIFPNQASVLRLMGSVAIDYHETMSQKKPLFYNTSMMKISENTRKELIVLAHEQKSKARAA
jgi:transposase-like protein